MTTLDAETIGEALRCGGSVRVNAVTGEATVRFDRRDYTAEEWRALLEGLGLRGAEEDDP